VTYIWRNELAARRAIRNDFDAAVENLSDSLLMGEDWALCSWISGVDDMDYDDFPQEDVVDPKFDKALRVLIRKVGEEEFDLYPMTLADAVEQLERYSIWWADEEGYDLGSLKPKDIKKLAKHYVDFEYKCREPGEIAELVMNLDDSEVRKYAYEYTLWAQEHGKA